MYIVLKDLLLKGKRYVASDVIETIGDEDAKNLLAMGRIEAVAVTPEVKAVDRSVGLSNETKPKRRAKSKKAK
tara:strand:+ start:2092 stop:2310 length:219 start_codon:yes stop_codon:yes gene_type:complete